MGAEPFVKALDESQTPLGVSTACRRRSRPTTLADRGDLAFGGSPGWLAQPDHDCGALCAEPGRKQRPGTCARHSRSSRSIQPKTLHHGQWPPHTPYETTFPPCGRDRAATLDLSQCATSRSRTGACVSGSRFEPAGLTVMKLAVFFLLAKTRLSQHLHSPAPRYDLIAPIDAF